MQPRLNLVKGINQRDLLNFTAAQGEGVVSLDPAGSLLSMNPEAERLLGWCAADLRGRDFFAETQLEFTDIRHLGAAPCPVLQSVSCSHLNTHARLRQRDGSPLDVTFMLSPLFDAGRVAGKVFVFRLQDADTPLTGPSDDAALLATANALVVKLDKAGEALFCHRPEDWCFGDAPLADFLPAAVSAMLCGSSSVADTALLERRWSEHTQRETSVLWSVALQRDAEGRVTGALCIGSDCTGLNLGTSASQRASCMTRTVFEYISDGVIAVDVQGNVQYLNPEAEHLTGWSFKEAEGQSLRDVYHVVDEHDHQPKDDPVTRCLSGRPCDDETSTGLLLRRGGWEFNVQDRAMPLRDDNGELEGVVLVFSDVSELRGLERLVEYEASHDGLTGLFNRRQFELHLHEVLDSVNDDERQHALLYLDLDHFQIINDSYGHVAGDQLLKELSRELKSELAEGVCLARLGDDEFGIIIEDIAIEPARQLARNLCKLVRASRFVWEDKPFEIGASIGLVPITSRWRDVGELMRMAASACYVANEHGGNRVHVYEIRDAALAQREGDMRWIQVVRQALLENNFRLYCQNIVPLGGVGGAEPHFEILLRMINENGEVVRPAAFIAAAERYHLMSEIDRWVIRNALKLLSERRQRGNDHSTFSINISGQSLDDEDFLGFVVDELCASDVPPENICFEITETAAASNLVIAQRFISVLRGMGCRFALDDFGRGISSFAYLKNLKVDYLKIDGMFVKDLAEDEIGHAMVESINNIGHTMGVKTIAEFVETEAVLERLVLLGVDYVQGYKLGRPRPLAPLFVAADKA